MSVTADLAIIIRFKNSAVTLPSVLAALRAQTTQPARIIGIDTGSTDSSPSLLSAAGAEIIHWEQPYHHSRVLNFGMARIREGFALILSSHTVLTSPGTIAAMLAQMAVPDTACVSGKWAEHDAWSDAITWSEIQRTGLRFCSVYSNSFGMLRRALWEKCPFDESLVTMEDYAWALEQLQRGYTCRRVPFPFEYQRSAQPREYVFAATTFHLAHRYGLAVKWLGVKGTLGAITANVFRRFHKTPTPMHEHIQRLRAFLASRLSGGRFRPATDC